MATEEQRILRLVLVGALLLGGAIWYSWTAQHEPIDHPPAPILVVAQPEQPERVEAAAEVDAQPSRPDAEQSATND